MKPAIRIAGIGLRSAASMAALEEALAAIGGARPLAALATLSDKAEHPALLAFSRATHLPIRTIAREDLAGLATLTRSCRIIENFGTGSVAEACALAAAGPGARLITPRFTTADGMVTIALAEGTSP